MIFSNIDFTLKYVDPSATENGDGLSPETPLNVLPSATSDLTEDSCYIIRRTSEESSVLLPQGINETLKNIIFIGMPKNTDEFWELMPLIAQEEWGSDEAEYANICVNTGDDPWGNDLSFQLPNVKTFLLHRVYLFRDNTQAFISMIRFTAQDYTANVNFKNCKFGAKGIDLNLDSYTTHITNTCCKSFVEVSTANVFSMQNCIINCEAGMDDYYGMGGYPFNLSNANHITISDVEVFVTTSQYGADYGPTSGYVLNLSNGSWTGAYTTYENIKFNILINGNFGYLPSLFYSANNEYCLMRNVSVGILERKLGEDNPTLLSVASSMIASHNSREFLIENITVDLPKCWRVDYSGRVVSITGFSNSTVPGHSKSIKNITINLAETDGLDSEHNGNYYDEVKDGTTDIGHYPYYSALDLSFSERSYAEGAWEPVIVSNINVNHHRGVALYAYGCQIRNCNIKGTVKLRRCVADITKIDSYYPGYAIFAAEATTLKVGTLTLGKENAAITGGADDYAVGSRYSDASFIYVGNANGALKSNIGETVTNVWNGYNMICGNEVDNGHYTCRSVNYLCDTWNAHRTNGAPAAFKFSSSANGLGGVVLGRVPFQGIRLTPTQIGKHNLTMHIAAKNMSNMELLNNQLMLQITIPRANGNHETIFSSTCGQWLDDSDAVWVNDSEMEQRRIVIPINITELDTIDVKIHYKWYSANGYVYIDPAISLETVE